MDLCPCFDRIPPRGVHLLFRGVQPGPSGVQIPEGVQSERLPHDCLVLRNALNYFIDFARCAVLEVVMVIVPHESSSIRQDPERACASGFIAIFHTVSPNSFVRNRRRWRCRTTVCKQHLQFINTASFDPTIHAFFPNKGVYFY